MTQAEALALTLVIEAATAAALSPAFARKPWLGAAAAVAGSLVTHPVLWAVFGVVHAHFGAMTTPVLEAVVIAAETLAYRAIATPRWTEAALFSVLANAASWDVGVLIYELT